ncbi:hypothetical protein Tco_0060247 [Tanacetum coccineum]
MQRPPLFKSDCFIYWKNRLETSLKVIDLDLWHIILNGDFPPVAKNEVTQVLEEVPFEQQDDNLKEHSLKIMKLNGNSQVKDNKIDLLGQQYEQFTILEEESIDSGFARFNTIITSLKAPYEGFSRKNYVRKFLRALHPKWRAKVMAIEESKELLSLALDKLIGNLKVHKVVMENDSEIYRSKKERVKSVSFKAKKESSDDETLTSRSDDKEYYMADDAHNTLTNLRTKFENAFHSEFEERMRKYTRYNAQSFNDAMICTMDSIRKYMLEIILHQQRTLHLLKQKTLMQTQEDHSNQTQALNSDSLKVDLVVKQNSCSKKEGSNSETASNN